MYFAQLNQEEKQIVLQSMKAVLESGALELEYSSRLGIEEEELREVIEKFPNLDDSGNASNDTLAINGCLNEVCHGINFTEMQWRDRFSYSREETVKVFKKWRKLHGLNVWD